MNEKWYQLYLFGGMKYESIVDFGVNQAAKGGPLKGTWALLSAESL
jgi:hypothetical protein